MACSAITIALFPPDISDNEIFFGEIRKEHCFEKVAPWADLAIGAALLAIGILGMQYFPSIGTVPSQILFGVGAAYLSFSIVIAFVHVKNKVEARLCNPNEEHSQPTSLSFNPNDKPSPPASPFPGRKSAVETVKKTQDFEVRKKEIFRDWTWQEGDPVTDEEDM